MKYFYCCLLFALSQCVLAQNTKLPANLGVQLYSFRADAAKDASGMLKKVQSMGFQVVETAGFYGMSAPEFKKALDAHGFKVGGTGVEFAELSDPVKLQTVASNAKIIGAKFVVCFWIPHDGDKFTIDDIKKAVTVFSAAGKTLRAQGLKLLYHPHGFEFRPYGDGVLFDYLVQNTNPKYLNFEMDIYWIKNPGQDPVYWLKKYPKRWKTMHLKDQQKGTPGSDNAKTDVEWNVTIGQGNQDMPAVMAQAKRNKIKYYYIEDESSRSLTQVPQSAAYLLPLLR
jgi:sugar phosphate isomerase/epimerase